jgi:hypothetical protein
VPRKGELTARCEDAHLVIGAVNCGRQQERGFGQMGPRCEALHGRFIQLSRVMHDGQRISPHGLVSEDIQLTEPER